MVKELEALQKEQENNRELLKSNLYSLSQPPLLNLRANNNDSTLSNNNHQHPPCSSSSAPPISHRQIKVATKRIKSHQHHRNSNNSRAKTDVNLDRRMANDIEVKFSFKKQNFLEKSKKCYAALKFPTETFPLLPGSEIGKI